MGTTKVSYTGSIKTTTDVLLEAITRLEHKVDTLIAALAEEDDEEPTRTLDGDPIPRERDQTHSL